MIMYGQIGSPMFIDLHTKLKNISNTKGINYILRYYLKVKKNFNGKLIEKDFNISIIWLLIVG